MKIGYTAFFSWLLPFDYEKFLCIGWKSEKGVPNT
jgi:hypothetical protein